MMHHHLVHQSTAYPLARESQRRVDKALFLAPSSTIGVNGGWRKKGLSTLHTDRRRGM